MDRISNLILFATRRVRGVYEDFFRFLGIRIHARSGAGYARPRKQPVQARSEATVLAIFEANFRVLRFDGYRKLTTTRVAERAGVSIGTLYQYFPNRQALVRAVLERYLAEMSASIEADCRSLQGGSLDETADRLIDAFIAAKWRRLEVSRALLEPLVEVGGVELVRASATEGAAFVADLREAVPRSAMPMSNP